MAEFSIRATLNGPLIVRGGTELLDTAGDKYPLDKDTVSLCRCGQSSNKPFCDGTHAKIGFKAAETVADMKR